MQEVYNIYPHSKYVILSNLLNVRLEFFSLTVRGLYSLGNLSLVI